MSASMRSSLILGNGMSGTSHEVVAKARNVTMLIWTALHYLGRLQGTVVKSVADEQEPAPMPQFEGDIFDPRDRSLGPGLGNFRALGTRSATGVNRPKVVILITSVM